VRHALRQQVMQAILAGGLLVPAGAFAQEAQSNPQTPRVDRRENRQQKRIAQGVKSGQLTPEETVKLEREQGKIKRDEARQERWHPYTERARKTDPGTEQSQPGYLPGEAQSTHPVATEVALRPVWRVWYEAPCMDGAIRKTSARWDSAAPCQKPWPLP